MDVGLISPGESSWWNSKHGNGVSSGEWEWQRYIQVVFIQDQKARIRHVLSSRASPTRQATRALNKDMLKGNKNVI